MSMKAILPVYGVPVLKLVFVVHYNAKRKNENKKTTGLVALDNGLYILFTAY